MVFLRANRRSMATGTAGGRLAGGHIGLEGTRHGKMDESDLVMRLKSCDEASFRHLVRRHHANMIAVARSYVASVATAEEVVQDTWVAVISGIGGFEGRSSLKNWIYAILVNKARTRGARDGRTVSLDENAILERQEDPADVARFDAGGGWADPPRLWHDLTPERIVDGDQIWHHVRKAIDELPPAQRAVVILRDVEGHESREICEILQISEANQRVLLHRARAKLRSVVERLAAPQDSRAKSHPGLERRSRS